MAESRSKGRVAGLRALLGRGKKTTADKREDDAEETGVLMPAMIPHGEGEGTANSDVTPDGTDDHVDVAPPYSNGGTFGGSTVTAMIDIQRPALSQSEFDKRHGFRDVEDPACTEAAKALVVAKCTCSRQRVKKSFLGFFPFIDMLLKYKWKQWLVPDLIAGLCLAAVNVPQGMGYALLCAVPPIYGVYSSLFPPLVYFFFGTSYHIALGTMAVPSMMTGAVVDREYERIAAAFPSLNETHGNGTEPIDEEAIRVGVATTMCLLMGLFQVAMGILNMGNLAAYMSAPFVHAFLSGAGCHILISQIPLMLGLQDDVKIVNEIGKIPISVVKICSHFPDVNPAALVGSLICIVILVFLKEYINVKYKSKLKVPVPADLIVLALGTLVSYLTHIDDKFDVAMVGDIPSGLPAPKVPPLEKLSDFALEAFVVALVSFAISVTMVKMYAERYHYEINTNQEMLAYGLSYGISSLFRCHPGAQAPTRSLIGEAAGGKTQVSNFVSSILLILVCMTLGPAFESLPLCVLGSIISVAIIPLFRQFRDFPLFWKLNKMDGIVWLVTLSSVVFLDVITGLILGLGTSLLLMVLQAQLQKVTLVTGIKGTEIYRQGALYKDTEDARGVKIFQVNSSLFYANVHVFKNMVLQSVIAGRTVIDPDGDQSSGDGKHNALNLIILDCSGLRYIDFMGLATLKQLRDWCKRSDVKMVLAACSRRLMTQLKQIGMFGDDDDDDDILYPTVHDAVVSTVGWDNLTATLNTKF